MTTTTAGKQQPGGKAAAVQLEPPTAFAFDAPDGSTNLLCPNADATFCAVCCPCLSLCPLFNCVMVKEGEAFVVMHFGKFSAVIKRPGLYNINCCERTMTRRSLKERSLTLSDFKILDSKSNPILVGGAVFYRVEGVRASVFEVEDVQKYMHSTFETVLKNVCSQYPYEADEENPFSLKSESAKISQELAALMQNKMNHAGIRIISCNLTDLSYAPEIAQPMLMRQQAEAMVKARALIVAGAVAMTEDAINRLTGKGIQMTDGERAIIIKNLLTVICGKER